MVKIACCWDDGLENDIRLIELLKKYHAKATFNLNPGLAYPTYRKKAFWQFPSEPDFVNRDLAQSEWRDLYRGFKIASHGYFHADVHRVSTEEYVYDATEARKYLEDFFQQEVPGFVYGGGAFTIEAANGLRDAGFEYGRTVVYTDNVEGYANPLLLQPSCAFLSDNFMELFEHAKQNHGTFYFWGHSCEMFNRADLWAEFERRLATISADPESQWIDVIDIVRAKDNK